MSRSSKQQGLNTNGENMPATNSAYDPSMSLRPSTVEAVRVFANSQPHEGDLDDRMSKFRSIHTILCGIYNTPIGLRFEGSLSGGRGSSRGTVSEDWTTGNPTITLSGKLSVVTYLRAFAQALGRSETSARRFAVNLFARCFPHKWENCHVSTQGTVVAGPGPAYATPSYVY